MAQSALAKRLGVLRRNLFNLGGVCWGYFLKGLYNFGLPLSILYGLNKTNMGLMMFYYLTGNEQQLERMGFGGPPPM